MHYMELSVIVLAGGHSSRFWPLEEKNLFNFFGVPLIVYQLRRYSHFLKQSGIKAKFVVITNESNHNLIKNSLAGSEGLSYKLVAQSLPNQYGAVIAGLREVPGKNPVLIINSNDVFTEKLIHQMIAKMNSSSVVLCGTPVEQYFPGGYLMLDAEKKQVRKIWEKPPEKEVPTNLSLLRLVLDFFPDPKELLEVMPKVSKTESYEDAINELLAQKKAEYSIYLGKFTSLKYPWHVLDAMDLFLSNIKENTIKTSNIDSTAQIVGPVYIEEGVKIGSYAKIVGPAFIGKNTVVADFVLIRSSHIGEECMVGSFSEVARSYLENRVMLHRNYVGDSILASGVTCGAGAITANWRFDHETVKSPVNGVSVNSYRPKLGAIIGANTAVGVGTCIMPGVKVEKKSKLLPNSTVMKDVRREAKEK